MTDELLLELAYLGDISPKKVALIIDAYEKSKTDVKPVPEGYTAFEYEGRHYAYKSLREGTWTPRCASLELMKVLRNYFIDSGKMEEGGSWPGSSCDYAWARDVDPDGYHGVLDSGGCTDYFYDGFIVARFAVLPLDSERKNFIKEASHENETI